MSKRINRRKFLSVSTLTGYSLFVKVENPLFGQQNKNIKEFDHLVSKNLSPGSINNEPNMRLVNMDCDVLVAGGGMAGVCTAISAARHGAKVLLVQDRSRLGGNASSEIRMHIVGADSHGSRAGWRESGLIEELRLEDAVFNPQCAWELWDLLLYDKCINEPNLTLLLDSVVYSAEKNGSSIQSVMVRCDKTEHLYRVKAQIYCDCTGDSRLALEAAAEYRQGREDQKEFGESLAGEKADSRTQGSSILFTSKKYDKPVPFKPPTWARKITKKQLRFRPVGSWEYGYWWIELGGMIDTIRDNEQLRFELLSIVLGVWDYIKNSGNHPGSANWALETIGMIPGKRESRRILGDHIMTQADLEGAWKMFKDGVAIGGWGMDDHPPEGFDAPEKQPFKSIPLPEPYNISFGALYSRNISNLMMAGRNISCSHVAFTSTRVMATCSVIGQAVGTAAAVCVKNRLLPHELRTNSEQIKNLQQILLRDDQTIRNVKNQDLLDVARNAKVTASSYFKNARPEHIINGLTRDMPGEWKNRWAAEMKNTEPWIELHWKKPQKISFIQIVFDSGFHRELTLSAHAGVNQRVLRSPQPETVKAYTITARTKENNAVKLVDVKDNYQRLCRHNFDPIQAVSVRFTFHATHGAKEARLYEIRCYR
jgi:hypothetical protein